MTRGAYGGGAADFVQTVVGNSYHPAAAAAVTMWSAQTGGTRYTDLQNAALSAITSVTTNADGSVPVFYGPDGIAQMWADAGGAERVMLTAYNLSGLAGNFVSYDTSGGNSGFANQTRLPPPVAVVNLHNPGTSGWTLQGIAVPKLLGGVTVVARRSTLVVDLFLTAEYIGGSDIGLSVIVADNGGAATTPMIAPQDNPAKGLALASGVTDLLTPDINLSSGYGQMLARIGGREGPVTAAGRVVCPNPATVGKTYTVQIWAQPYQYTTASSATPGIVSGSLSVTRAMVLSPDNRLLWVTSMNSGELVGMTPGRPPLFDLCGVYGTLDEYHNPWPGDNIRNLVPFFSLQLPSGAHPKSIAVGGAGVTEWAIAGNSDGNSVSVFNCLARYYPDAVTFYNTTVVKTRYANAFDIGRYVVGGPFQFGTYITAVTPGVSVTLSAPPVTAGFGDMWLVPWVQQTIAMGQFVQDVTIHGTTAWATLNNGTAVPITLPTQTAGVWSSATTGTAITLPGTSANAGGIRYSNDGTKIAIADFANGTVEIYDSTSLAHLTTVTLSGGGSGIGPFRIRSSPDNTWWVAGFTNCRLYQISTSGTVLTNIDLTTVPPALSGATLGNFTDINVGSNGGVIVVYTSNGYTAWLEVATSKWWAEMQSYSFAGGSGSGGTGYGAISGDSYDYLYYGFHSPTTGVDNVASWPGSKLTFQLNDRATVTVEGATAA